MTRLPVRIVSASAGTGKTHRIVQELLAALLQGEACPPSGIILTTFTEKAAAEVAQRAREELVAGGRPDLALRLDEALLGTVHSVCGKLLRRFAFEAGLPPEHQVLDEPGSRAAFAEAVTGCLDPQTVERMWQAEQLLSLRAPRSRAESPWREQVLAVVEAARTNGLGAEGLRASAEESVRTFLELLPEAAGDPDALDSALARAVREALAALALTGDTTKLTAGLTEQLERLQSVVDSGHRLPWVDWLRLAKAQAGARSRHVAEALAAAAAPHLSHPRLRADVAAYIRDVFELAARSLALYQTWKRERSLMDFDDLEAEALRLLDLPEVAGHLRDELRLVLVDEFQDTSPIQLAIFLRLSALSPRSIWVGDPKQTIFGFRGTDPALMEAVVRELPEPVPQDVLGESFRSRPTLVDLTSALFARAFEPVISEARVRVRARRAEPPGLPPAVWRWRLSASRQDEAASAVARGIRILLGLEGEPAALVSEGRSSHVRPVRAGDIAVLCRTRAHCDEVAEALERAGVRAARARTGLLSTPEAVLALACLRRALDRRDSLATAELAVLTSDRLAPDDWLLERLRYLETGQPQEDWRRDDPAVTALDRLHQELPALSPSEALDRALDAGEVHRRALAWGRASVRMGNLEALRGLCASYEASCAQLRAGASVAGFLHWLSLLPDEEADEQAEGTGPDSVQVLTVHASKGLEWPVVILGDLQWSRDAEVFGLTVVDPRPRLELDRPLASRWLRLWPWPWGQHSAGTGLETTLETHPASLQARAAHDGEALRLLYVAMTRARDILVLPARSGKNGRPQQGWLDRLAPAGDEEPVLPFPAQDGDLELLEGPLRIAVRVATLAPAEPAPRPAEAVEWFPAARRCPPELPSARAASKLQMPPGFALQTQPPLTVGGPIAVTGALDAESMGNAVHAFLGADDPAAGTGAREHAAAALLLRHGAPGALPPASLVRCSDDLRAALTRLHGPPLRELREWPVSLRLSEIAVSGWLDLAWELPGGWVVVDYKTRGTGGDDFLARAADHGAQLGAYALALTRVTDKPVVASYVHLVLAGLLVPIELPAGAALEELVRRSVTQG